MTPPIYRKPDPRPEYRGPVPLRPNADPPERVGRSVNLTLTLAVGLLFLGLIAAAVFLSSCGSGLPPFPPLPTFFPPKPATLTPTPTAPGPTRTPEPPPRPSATGTRTVPAASPTRTATATPTSGPVTFLKSTGGRAVFALDLTNFAPVPGIDSYAFATVCWEEPNPPRAGETICIQLGLRGTKMPACERKPCQGRMAVEVRASANAKYDGQDMSPPPKGTPGVQYRPESEMCGEGTRPPKWMPLGPVARLYDITLEWGPAFGDGLFVATAVDRVNLTQGMRRPGFGWWTEGIPCAPNGGLCGIGYLYLEKWTVQAYRGRAALRASEIVEPLPIMSRCP